LPLPPLPEQHRIVSALDDYFSRLDAATAALERARRNLVRYRASVLHAAVTGRLVPTEAELARAEGRDYEPASDLLARILKERRQRWEETELAKMVAKGKPPADDRWKARYTEPVGVDAEGLGELPEGWCWASGDQLFSVITSGSRDWTKYYGQGSATFVMAQNVRPGRLDLNHRQLVGPPEDDPSRKRSQVIRGDLLVTIVGANTGDVCRIVAELPEHYVCQSVALMRPVDPSVSRFTDLYLNSTPGRAIYERFMYGQGRPHLGFDQLRETPVPLPPIDEQHRIGRAVDELASVDEAMIVSIIASTVRLTRLRQSILRWAFEGRLVDQDPGDEPAAVLLERIRTGRAAGASTQHRGKHKRRVDGQERLL